MTDILISIVNAASSIAIAAVLIAAILSKRVHDGVVIKFGLCCVALGFAVIALHMLRIGGADAVGLERALLLVNSGIAVVIIGYVWRYRHAGHALRRLTDWADLDSRHR